MTPEKSRRVLNLQQRSALAGEAAAAAAEVETALATPADPSVGGVLRRRQHDDAGREHLPSGQGLHRRKFFTTREILAGGLEAGLLPRSSASRTPSTSPKTRASALSFIAGHTVAELEELGEEIFDEAMAHRIWPGTRALAQMHLDEGERVWLVTAAPIEIARIIARRLGLTGALGTVAEHEDGVYTGRLVGDMLHGPAKAEAIKALAAREGLDLARCSAYSDSFNDLPHALPGRPSRARSTPTPGCGPTPSTQGWRIRDYRTGRKAARAGLVAAAVAGAAPAPSPQAWRYAVAVTAGRWTAGIPSHGVVVGHSASRHRRLRWRGAITGAREGSP